MISPLIKWQHEDQWEISKYAKKTSSGERDILIRLKEHEYLRGHVIDGRNLYPATGYLVSTYPLSSQRACALIIIKELIYS